jgi:hypothetical protein
MPRRRSVILMALVVASLLAPGFALAQDDPLQASTKTVNVELIVDASGSMAELLPGGETRMDAAKRILRQVITDLPDREGVNVGLRVYGHEGDNTVNGKAVSCGASELLVPVSGVFKDVLLQQVEAIQPTGWTPIAYSLEQARADFQPGGESITNAIVLVTDGEETCDLPEQSCQASAALHQADVTVTTHVVGFALTPEQTELVRCVAEEGGGQLFGAENAEELGQALTTALGEAGVPVTPAPVQQVAAPASLADIHTLAYHQLTTWTTGVDPGGERAPILSDDGQTIAFTRDPGSGDPANPNRIFVMNADGSSEREVDAYQTLCFCTSMIDISADGSTVVSSDAVQLRIADANGGGGRELLVNSSNEINAVRISGDGRTVVFRIYRDTQQFERGIWAINADGTGLRQLVGPAQLGPLLGVAPEEAPFFGGTSGLDVSANGGRIVFTGYADVDPATGSAREALFAVNGDGSDLHRLLGPTFTFVLANAISGDGSTVAYITSDFATGRQDAGVVGFDGSGERSLTDNTTSHPGTGANLPSGERIQLGVDGTRLLLATTGLLFNTRDGAQLALGLEIPPAPGQRALVPEGLPVATMDMAATRVVYLFQPAAGPLQLARLDLNPAEVIDVPLITEARVDPNYVLIQGRSTATVGARVSPLEPAPWVGVRVLRNGLPDDTSFTRIALVDDGATGGDAAASDGVFTNTIATCCEEVGLRTVRLQAERVTADGVQQAMAVDITPFAVVADRADAPLPATPAPPTVPAPATETPATAVPPATVPPTGVPPAPTPPTAIPGQGVPGPGGGSAGTPPTPAPPAVTEVTPTPAVPVDPAQATIAAQATLIAELEAQTPIPPTPAA